MKYTSAEANKLLKKFQEEFNLLVSDEANAKTYSLSSKENVDDVRPEYDINDTFNKIEDYQKKIRTIKHAINVFNTTTVIPDVGITIDEALVRMPQLVNMKNKYNSMCLPREKTRDRYVTDDISYTYLNYDRGTARSYYNKVNDELTALQLALDKVNATLTIEIDV